eukprot:7636272-Pyramimonas_sp.AAC.1
MASQGEPVPPVPAESEPAAKKAKRAFTEQEKLSQNFRRYADQSDKDALKACKGPQAKHQFRLKWEAERLTNVKGVQAKTESEKTVDASEG